MRIIGHGIDLTSIDRIQRLLAEHPERFLSRCFTECEQAYAAERREAPAHYAARFSAKEAALKALGTGLRFGIQWTDIEVCNDGLGQPMLRLSGKAAEIARRLGINQWFVSLTHTAGMASASVIAVGDPTTTP
ncbi:MAG: holo-ACP synthase [Phycisphaerales bacterium]